MKKSALALAIAAAVGASGVAAADTILYGSARPSVDYTDVGDSIFIKLNERLPVDQQNQTLRDVSGGYWDVIDNSSRLGVRGSEDLGGGLSAIYQFEFGVDMTNGDNFVSNRPKWAGLKGGWGALTLGTQWTPYYNVLGAADVFNMKNRAAGPFNTGRNVAQCLPAIPVAEGELVFPSTGSPAGYNCDTTYLGPLRYDNSVLYTTPNWNGLSAQAMLVMNGLQGTPTMTDRSNGVDGYDLNIKYENGPWFAGVAFDRLTGSKQYETLFPGRLGQLDDALSLWGVALGYNADAWGLNFNVEYQDGTYNAPLNLQEPVSAANPRVSNNFETLNYYLVGRYSFGNNVLRAAWGYFNPRDFGKFDFVYVDPDTDFETTSTIDGSKVQNVVLGWQYNFSKRTRTWVEWTGRFADIDLSVQERTPDQPAGRELISGGFPYPSVNAVSVGMRHDF